MFQIAISSAVRQEALKDPALAALLDDECRYERGRYAAWDAENRRHRGVCYSGMGPGPFVCRTGEEMLSAAKVKLAERRQFTASPEGAFSEAIWTARKLLVDLTTEIERADAARSRSWLAEHPTCAASMARVEALATELKLIALDAQLAVDRVSDQPEEAA